MLTLTRHTHEEVVVTVGETQFSIWIVDVKGDRVKLGLDAPANVVFNRREVHDAMIADKMIARHNARLAERKLLEAAGNGAVVEPDNEGEQG
jgi:carbon storage regulator CsrA